MTNSWQSAAESQLQSEIVEKQRLGGGDFAESYQALLADGREVFIKTHANPPENFFSTEAVGLQWLRDSQQVNVPAVLGFSDDPPFLALQYIDFSTRNTGDGAATETDFGRQLAKLHQSAFNCFGRPDARTTGSQALPNESCETWAEFYATQRLLPLAKIATDKQALSIRCTQGITKLAHTLDAFEAADEPARLLHGDLWAGNRVVDANGQSWLIDPAAHGGHREFDLAMMRLFGGYDQACFAAYQELFPLQAGWQDRISLHQLAPLMVHAIKFGGSYSNATEQALAKYQ